jgi:hypothetical protein
MLKIEYSAVPLSRDLGKEIPNFAKKIANKFEKSASLRFKKIVPVPVFARDFNVHQVAARPADAQSYESDGHARRRP